MNALEEFDQQSGSQNAIATQQVDDKKSGIKRSRSTLSPSTMPQTLLPPSQESSVDDQDQVLTVVQTKDKTVLRTTVTRKNPQSKSSYLGKFYKVQGYTRDTTYKVTGKKPNGADILVRNGAQIWRDNMKRVVRVRRFVNGKLQGLEQIFCYPVKHLNVVGGEQGETSLVYLNRCEVFSRNFVNGVQEGKQTRYDFTSTIDELSNTKVFTIGKTCDTVTFVAGKKHGVEMRIRNSNSTTISSVEYVNGVKQGTSKNLYDNGTKTLSSWQFQNGVCVSGCSFFRNSMQMKEQLVQTENGFARKVFDKNGTLVRLITLNGNGQKHGEQIFTKNGKQETATWKDGCRLDSNGQAIPSSTRTNKRTKNVDDDN